MNASTRACVACAVISLYAGRFAGNVYDYTNSGWVSLSGTVTDKRIDIYDHDSSSHFNGSGHNGRFSLYHYGNRSHVDLSVRGKTFDGYDYHSRKHFSGTISGRSVSLYDYESSTYHNLSA